MFEESVHSNSKYSTISHLAVVASKGNNSPQYGTHVPSKAPATGRYGKVVLWILLVRSHHKIAIFFITASQT